MASVEDTHEDLEYQSPVEPVESEAAGAARAITQILGAVIPGVGGVLSAIAGAWGEQEQQRANDFFKQYLRMLEDELREKHQTIIEIVARLDVHDEDIAARITSEEYQSLLKKAFRDWAGTESEQKRVYIRNILSNAAAVTLTSDDVVRLFLDWIKKFSELHFVVIAAIYNEDGITRAEIWRKIGKGEVREDSAEADLYKLLFHDLSVGHIIRQYRETDSYGNFVKNRRSGGGRSSSGTMVSAFDTEKPYILTDLGQQFVHYAMTDVPPKITYAPDAGEPIE